MLKGGMCNPHTPHVDLPTAFKKKKTRVNFSWVNFPKGSKSFLHPIKDSETAEHPSMDQSHKIYGWAQFNIDEVG